MNRNLLLARQEIIAHIHRFFQSRSYLEVNTPLLAPDLIPETSIEVFETLFSSPFHREIPLYLVPSPEVYMKRLIAQGSGNIYQISKCFRNSEQIGKLHNPEFTMLEYYAVPGDYMASIDLTEALISELIGSRAQKLETPGSEGTISVPFRRMSVEEAVREFTGIALPENQKIENLREAALSAGISAPGNEKWEDLFNRIFLTHVEPELPSDRPLVLIDYPKQIRCLAKEVPGKPYLQRWELYIQGVEIANCFTEETDSGKVEAFYREEYQKKAAGSRVVPDIDPDFPRLFGPDYPECSGTALGVDRLIMTLTEKSSLEGLILFPVSDILRYG